jgi:hypothetical protein
MKKLKSLAVITAFASFFAPNILGASQQMEKQEMFQIAYRMLH